MPLTPNTKLGSYEILSPIGAGGMGEVYRARDNKLGREVAIKVLPEEFTQHPQKLARFEREARLLATLNHPGIATLYGVEEFETKPFLVMELVEGETLAERIARGPLPVDEALTLSQQIAEAVEAAHEKGVIHRDLKPANIKVDPEGHIKVLDFGLAKAFADEVPDGELSASPTLSRDATRAGVILGTAAYMSPEQAKGKTVDKRTDIFSFGIVLYEMLTGKKAFAGEDVSEVLASIIKTEPDWKAVPTDLDPRIQNLLRRCLRKDRKNRRQSIGGRSRGGSRHPRRPRYCCVARESEASSHYAMASHCGRPAVAGCRSSPPVRGAALTIAEVSNGRGGTWGPDDSIVYTPMTTTGLYRVPASGGTPVELTQLSEGERSHRWPWFLPSGQAVLFMVQAQGASYDDGTIEAFLLETGERKVLNRGGTYPRYASSGHLLYPHEATLFAMPFDADRIEPTGEPSPVLEGVLTYGGLAPVMTALASTLFLETDRFSTFQEDPLWTKPVASWYGLIGTEEKRCSQPSRVPTSTRGSPLMGADSPSTCAIRRTTSGSGISRARR